MLIVPGLVTQLDLGTNFVLLLHIRFLFLLPNTRMACIYFCVRIFECMLFDFMRTYIQAYT